MFDMIREALENLYFVEEGELDPRAIEEIARFLSQDDHELDVPVDPDDLPKWIKEHGDSLHWLYEYLTRSTNMIYGGSR